MSQHIEIPVGLNETTIFQVCSNRNYISYCWWNHEDGQPTKGEL